MAYRKRRRSWFWRWRRPLFLTGLVLAAGSAIAVYWVSLIELPPVDAQAETTFIFDVNGNPLAELHAEEDRVLVTLDQVPQVMVDAVIAAEDRDFFTHPGVNPLGIARAAWADIRNRSIEQGGSTITQQLVKNRFLSSERTLTRKIREAVLAIRLEQDRDKEDILEDYLNTVYFGRGAYGVQAASQTYYGLDVEQIGLREATYLAGLIRSPESADAGRFPEVADARRESVLVAMREEGYISAGQLSEVSNQPLSTYVRGRLANNESVEVLAGEDIGTQYFVEYVRAQLSEKYGDAVVFGGGLRVHTSLDLDLQRAAYEAVHETLDRDGDPEASLVAIDDQGLVRAMYGGDSWPEKKVNLAVGGEGGGSGRQPGSSFKPLVLAEFLNQGNSIKSRFNAPRTVTIKIPGEDWEPSNYANSSYGVIDLIKATTSSVNTAYAQVIEEVGPENAKIMAHKLGVTTDILPVHAMVLGGVEVSVLDMATAYSTFMNRGIHKTPRVVVRVEDASGNVIDSFEPKAERVLDEQVSDTVNYALKRVVSGGTATGARLSGHQAAGKTGTTNDNKDAWFVGYTPTLAAAVWMGYADPDPDTGQVPLMRNVHGRRVTGGSFPATIWKRFMTKALEGVDDGRLPADPRSFPGEVLNSRLSVTRTTLPLCTGAAGEDQSKCRLPTTTTLPTCTGTEEDPSSCSKPTSTTAPSGSSTTTTEPSGTTTTAPRGSTTTTTTSTTVAPTTTTKPAPTTTTTTDPPPPVPDA